MAIEYAAEVNPQVTLGPVIAPGAVAATLKANVLGVPVPQTLVPAAEILPLVYPLIDTLITLVPLPPVMLIPGGTLHE